METLGRDFYLRDAETVAIELLGKKLVRRCNDTYLVMEISETEAYLGVNDPACHSFRTRRTQRTEVMYGPGGYAYIYFIYGMYYMLNAVTGNRDDPCAVLIRAGNVLEGHDTISRNRFGIEYAALTRNQKQSLSDGPGKLALSFALTKEHNGIDLTSSDLTIRNGKCNYFTVKHGPRIGVDYAGEAALWPLNFTLKR